MKKLLKVEIEVLKHFDITATKIQMADGNEWMPPLDEVATFCMHNGYSYAAYDKVTAGLLLYNLADKITEPEDAISLEDLATWLLTNYFTRAELEEVTSEDALKFLQDWKYFGGFRKTDPDRAMVYLWNALAVFDGAYILNPDSEDIEYIRNEELTYDLDY